MDDNIKLHLRVDDRSSLTCKLPRDKLSNRIKFLKNKIFSTYESRDEIENGYILVYDNNKEIAHNLLDFIVGEQSCCSFIDFDLGFRPTKNVIEFKITTSTHEVNEFKKGMKQLFSF